MASKDGNGPDLTKKKVDPRIRTLVDNGLKTHHRSFFIIVGDKARNHVVTLFTIMTKLEVKARPSILWCYKKDLGFTSHHKKRVKEIKKTMRKGTMENDSEDPFEKFVASSEIRYTYYKDTHKILGNTFGMCVLQDFEAITPNVLARTIETVQGGGIVVILLNKMTSLKQLYTLTMDVHSHYKTESNRDVAPRFNERFILSLSSCQNCLVIDDELNILPITTAMQQITSVGTKKLKGEPEELKQLKESVKGTEPLGSVVALTRTIDQAKAVLTFVGAISEKSLRTTVSLTASRGRGKSAALGLSISAAVNFGYSNIFVTSPSPENLNTLFEFVFKGLDALGYKEHSDYELIQSTNPSFNKAIVRVNIYRNHRQTIQYIDPHDYQKLGQTELLVIDEAAAIPLPIVRSLLGPYLVFLSSTINGYEGTGRSLSLKLISQLREQSAKSNNSRVLQEVDLKEPCRYSMGDPVEKWLTELLCLDASNIPRIPTGFPHPNDCDLYYVNRDTLFSYHKASESFLQRLVALFVSSHYKNSPNDLMLMSDAPGHHLFVLLGPVDPNQKTLPEILCAIQVALEGKISKSKASSVLSGGADKAPDGDLIPWTLSQQFQDSSFASLSGARIVRIATNPDYQKMGYGSRALQMITQYYQGLIVNVDENEDENMKETDQTERSSLEVDGEIKPRKNLPPLLLELKDRKAEQLHYLGVSFGITQNLFSFWKKAGYSPMYIRQTTNDLTGENTCIMLKSLKTDDLDSTSENWLQNFNKDFRRRFVSLLSFAFKNFSISTALSVLDPKRGNSQDEPNAQDYTKEDLDRDFSGYDLKRLESYSRNLVDYHVIVDLLPSIGEAFFLEKINISLSPGQMAILLGMSLQRRTLEHTSDELTLPYDQVRALFNKSMRKFSQYLKNVQEKGIEKTLTFGNARIVDKLQPIQQSLNDELQESATQESSLGPISSKKANKMDIELERIKNMDSIPSTISIVSDKKRKLPVEEKTNDDEEIEVTHKSKSKSKSGKSKKKSRK